MLSFLYSVSLRGLREEGTPRRLRPFTRFFGTTERHQRLREGVRRFRIVGIVLAKDVSACLGAPVSKIITFNL